MRVLLVNGGIYSVPSHNGGTENVVYDLANSLGDQGCEVDLVSDVNGTPGLHENVTVHRVGLPDWRLDWFGFWGYAAKFAIAGWLAFRAAEQVRTGKHDVVHVHGRLAPYLMARGLQRNVVYTVHDDPPVRGSPHYAIHRTSYKLLVERTARKSERVVALHSQAREYLASVGVRDKAIALLPNGVDTTVFHPRGAVRGASCLFVGSLTRRKGVQYLLEALAAVDGLPCTIVGDGPERLPLERMAERLGIADRVIFAGAVRERARLADLYRSASFFVLPSSGDSLPLALLESMACGTPVIATKLPGSVETVARTRGGLLVNVADARDLADKMRLLRDSPGLRRKLGGDGQAAVERSYSWSSIAARTLEVYKGLLN